MAPLPRRVHAGSASKNEVSAGDQLLLLLLEPRRCELERGQLVHYVVDDQIGLQQVDELHDCGRVQPQDKGTTPPGCHIVAHLAL